MELKDTFAINVTKTDKVCAVGESYGRQCQQEEEIPVFSCEGGCIKGEIARQTANLIAREDGFARACHGELFSVPNAELSKWVRDADKVVVIDGCGLYCHGRIAENIISKDKLVIFDALSIHRKYADMMNVDDVPEEERKRVARDVAEQVLSQLNDDAPCNLKSPTSCGCSSD